jgi:cellulose synthase/poly-beta-1,6-N-acetylglucosamine synthase-like glycosyltransferase
VIAELVIFFALLALSTTIVIVLPGAVRTPIWLGLPLGAVAAAGAAGGMYLLTRDFPASEVLFVLALLFGLAAWALIRGWSYLAGLLMVAIVLAGVYYLFYSVLQALTDPLGPIVWTGTVILLILELAALGLSVSYAFEVLDVLSRRRRPSHPLNRSHRPYVALQVPTYNEPVEIVSRTLDSLARLDYPNYLVQVVDNNTKDPAVWRPLEQHCAQLGPRFHFMHLEPWPGYKAGALNEATRRLPSEVEVLGIVDADYVVRPGWLRDTVGHFADPEVAFVQTPQHYRDWQDDPYLRGLFYSYRYFFDVTMPARDNRNAIIFAGTMGLIRKQAFDWIGGWSTQTVTEDAEASLRMLGLGFKGVYVPEAYGEGMMPLSFDGLKKQRFRWALGGVQILRFHWREMLPIWPHRLRLSVGQRMHYLLGSVQWFGDLLTATFTVLLLLTAALTAFHHRLPVREILGPLTLVPILFLLTGVGRALWAIRVTARCTWGDAFRALRVWFALSWVVSLACMRGVVSKEAAFLRTPKHEERRSVWQAIKSSRTESTIAALAVVAAVILPVSAFSIGTIVLSVLLLWLALLYASAPWASFAAEGIKITPQRREFMVSSQNVGDWPERRIPRAVGVAVPLAAVAAAIAALLLATPPAPSKSNPPADFPQIQQVPRATATPTAQQTATPTVRPTPTATPTGRPTPSPTVQPTPTPSRPPATSPPAATPSQPARSASPGG